MAGVGVVSVEEVFSALLPHPTRTALPSTAIANRAATAVIGRARNARTAEWVFMGGKIAFASPVINQSRDMNTPDCPGSGSKRSSHLDDNRKGSSGVVESFGLHACLELPLPERAGSDRDKPHYPSGFVDRAYLVFFDLRNHLFYRKLQVSRLAALTPSVLFLLIGGSFGLRALGIACPADGYQLHDCRG